MTFHLCTQILVASSWISEQITLVDILHLSRVVCYGHLGTKMSCFITYIHFTLRHWHLWNHQPLNRSTLSYFPL